MKRGVALGIIICLCVGVLSLPYTSAGAATYTITKTADTNDGVCNADCSLREAVKAANGDAAADTITLPAGTYTLTIAGEDESSCNTGDLDINQPLTINGAGAATTIIDGGGVGVATGVDRVLDINGVAATISDVTIQGGESPTGATTGGGIKVDENSTLTLSSCIITQNDSGTNSGGGMYVAKSATVTITNCTFSSNHGSTGGAFRNIGGTVNVTNVSFIGNSSGNGVDSGSGGAIYNDNDVATGTATIKNSTFKGNTSTTSGGAVRAYEGTVNFVNCTLSENSAGTTGEAINKSSGGTVNITNSIIVNNGAALSDADCNGAVTSGGNNFFDTASDCGYSAPAGDLFGAAGFGTFVNGTDPAGAYYPLSSTSDAIDAGNAGVCLATDQIGTARSGTCDIGAIEWVTVCGDGIVGGNEECDNGDADNTDACLDSCENASCGDGFVWAGNEECDNGGANSDVLANACRTTCENPSCGDSVTDAGEGCDDGNASNNDACPNSCVSATCGDGVVQTGVEECDNSGANSDAMPNACRTACVNAYCGDGITDTGEGCDDGNADNNDECLNSCVAATCGDGVRRIGVEECDDGSHNSDDASDACRTNCIEAYCGDGVVDEDEECDAGDADDDACDDTCSDTMVGIASGSGDSDDDSGDNTVEGSDDDGADDATHKIAYGGGFSFSCNISHMSNQSDPFAVLPLILLMFGLSLVRRARQR